jgi:hypothetical protein
MKANDTGEKLMDDERARFAMLYGRREGVVNLSNFDQCREVPPECKPKKGLRTARSHVALVDDPLTSYTKIVTEPLFCGLRSRTDEERWE